jgi:diketogulonate reductase-like aldo/keto reductase
MGKSKIAVVLERVGGGHKTEDTADRTVQAVKGMLAELDIGGALRNGEAITNDYLDLYLIHSPKLGKDETIQV